METSSTASYRFTIPSSAFHRMPCSFFRQPNFVHYVGHGGIRIPPSHAGEAQAQRKFGELDALLEIRRRAIQFRLAVVRLVGHSALSSINAAEAYSTPRM
jgi:hypothetical protein